MTLTPDVVKDIIQVLREADADLHGVVQRRFRPATPDDISAAKNTRKHIAEVYKLLTGEEYKP